MITIDKILYFVIRFFFLIFSYLSKKTNILFLPHKEMCINDHYSILNYRSDSALTFARYILDNNLLDKRPMVICATSTIDISAIKCYLNNNSINREVKIAYPFMDSGNKWLDFKRMIYFYYLFSTSSHVFTSQTPVFRPLARCKRIKVVNLGYYMAPIKDSTHDKKSPFYQGYDTMSLHDFDYYIVSSEVSKRLIMATYGFEYNQYKTLGLCRNDYLYTKTKEDNLRNELLNKLSYKVKKIILYTPTHRDNKFDETNLSEGKKLMGFDANLEEMDRYFQKEGFYMICKMHPKQLKDIKKDILPQSIALFEPNHNYGLAELMKVSDLLVTDYTSGYFDYLILDKPVIFNLYDRERYLSNRGLIFNNIESICAGEIIYNQIEFFNALTNIEKNCMANKEKRKDILHMLDENLDSNSCSRIFNYFFS